MTKFIVGCTDLSLDVEYPPEVDANESFSVRAVVGHGQNFKPEVEVSLYQYKKKRTVSGQVVELPERVSSKVVTLPEYGSRTVVFSGLKVGEDTKFYVEAKYYGTSKELCGERRVKKNFTVKVKGWEMPRIRYSHKITKKRLKPGEKFSVIVNFDPLDNATLRVTVVGDNIRTQQKTIKLVKGHKSSLKFDYYAPTTEGKKDIKIRLEVLKTG